MAILIYYRKDFSRFVAFPCTQSQFVFTLTLSCYNNKQLVQPQRI